MVRALALVGALTFVPAVSSAQQPCTNDARQVVNEVYRHMLERGVDPGSQGWVDSLGSGRMTVKDVVASVAKSPEHLQRFTRSSSTEEGVGTVYRHILGRQPDADGRRGYVQMAGSRGWEAVVDSIMASREYESQFGAWG